MSVEVPIPRVGNTHPQRIPDLRFDLPAWHLDAACRGADPNLFFPERGEPTSEAKRICASCPVQTECLEYGVVENPIAGIWGGRAFRDRQALRMGRETRGREGRKAG